MQFYGQFDPPVDRFLFERYFSDSPKGRVCLECGAFDGIIESSCFFFEETLGWRAINVEASPPIFASLEKQRPKALNIFGALSDKDGEVSFTHVYHPSHGERFGNGSVLHTVAQRELLDRYGCTYRVFSVPSFTYRSLVDECKVDRIDLMVLDIEGHEFSALEGMRGARVLPATFCVEIGHLGLDPLRQMIEPMGYRFDTISHVNAFFVRR